jgi:hypothetical protein
MGFILHVEFLRPKNKKHFHFSEDKSVFFEPDHDGPPFDPLPTSVADPQSSVAASYLGDATCVAVQSNSAAGGSAGTVFGVGANCNKWGDAIIPP